MFSPLRSLLVVLSCLLAVASLTTQSAAQLCTGTTPCVTTWHNDVNRTGWQQHESALSPSTVNQSSFGLLQQWPVTGRVYAQPLVVNGITTQYTACKPCDLVLVATEEDMLYGFNGTSLSTSAPIWSLDLAGNVGGTPVKCGALPSGFTYDPCTSGLLGPYVGVTGTPVIDTSSANPNTLYVTAAVYFGGVNPVIYFYLFAVDTTTGHVRGIPVIISGMANGKSPGASGRCTSDFPDSGTVTFDYNHIQRSALLLLPSGKVYVAFAPGGGNELRNGWMLPTHLPMGLFRRQLNS